MNAEALSMLAELHAEAARHNPKPPTPERAAEFRKRMQALDPERAVRNIVKGLEPTADPGQVKRAGVAWDAWDDERDPHKKALLQMRLAEYVAGLLEHVEALEAQRGEERGSIVNYLLSMACMTDGSTSAVLREYAARIRDRAYARYPSDEP